MQQTRNLILFIALSFALLGGWTAFQNWMWPRKPRQLPPTPPVEASNWPFAGETRQKQDHIVYALSSASLLATAAAPDSLGQVVTELAVMARHTPPPPPKVEPPKVQPPTPTVPPESIPFGDDSYKLKVVLTTHGAGVESVTLNQFQAADKWGRPAYEDATKKIPEKLDLVPGGNGDPAHLVFQYLKPDDDRPVDTLGKLVWKLKSKTKTDEESQAVFEAELPDQKLRLTKTYTLDKGDYHIGLALKVERTAAVSGEAAKFKYQLTGAHGLPIEGEWYTYTHRNALIGWVDKKNEGWRHLEDSRQISFWGGGDLQSRGDKTITYGAIAVQYFASVVAVDDQQPSRDFLQAVRATLEQAVLKGRMEKNGPDAFTLVVTEKQKYSFKLAPNDSELQRRYLAWEPRKPVAVVWTMVGDQYVATDLRNEDETNPLLVDDITVRLISEPATLANKGDFFEHKYLLYNGPVKVRLLGQLTGERAVDPALVQRYEHTLQLNTLTDYPSPGVGGWISSHTGLGPLIIIFTNLMHWLLWHLHWLIQNWGISIILLTVIVRGIMCPISRRQMYNQMQMQEKMGKLAPEVKKLEEKYKGDYARINQEKTQLYMQHGINPLSTLGGCLLLFAQMPVFLGLYYALQESIHFRLQPLFSWLPWIPNLAAPDMLFGWSDQIPWLSTPSAQVSSPVYLGPFFNLLPIIAVAFMIVQQKLMQPPAADEQQEMQQKMMKWMMIVFGFMFYKVAAGLCIYFIASSLWGLAERKLFPKPVPATGGATAAGSSGGGSSAPPRPPRPRPDSGPNGNRPRDDNGSAGGLKQRLKNWWSGVLKEAAKQQQARRDDRGDGGGRERKKKRR
jgi:YidC/Oxa1 family membrane protein insertase